MLFFERSSRKLQRPALKECGHFRGHFVSSSHRRLPLAMQAAVRQAVVTGFNELARGVGTGLIVAAGSRCPSCSLSCPACPSLTCGTGYPTAVRDGAAGYEVSFGFVALIFLVGCLFGGGVVFLAVYDRASCPSSAARLPRGRVVRHAAIGA